MTQTATPEPFEMRVGNTGTRETVTFNSRTLKQFEKVREITQRPTFDFACSNIFHESAKDYTGPVIFIWYSKDGVLHATVIGKLGQTLREVEGT